MNDEYEFSIWLNSKILIYRKLLILNKHYCRIFLTVETTFFRDSPKKFPFLFSSERVTKQTRFLRAHTIKDNLVDEYPVILRDPK